MDDANDRLDSPAFQFYPDKWQSHTGHLSDNAYRIFHQTLCWMWLHGHDNSRAPAHPGKLARVLGRPRDIVEAALEELIDPDMPLLHVSACGSWLESRGLAKEAEKQAANRKQRRKAAHARWGTQPVASKADMRMHGKTRADASQNGCKRIADGTGDERPMMRVHGKPHADASGNPCGCMPNDPFSHCSPTPTPTPFKEKDGRTPSVSDPTPADELQLEGDVAVVDPRNALIPIVGGPTAEFAVPVAWIAEWERAYPSVDVHQTLWEIRAWVVAHPQRRKTVRGIRKFLTNWMRREQDGGMARR